MSRYIDAYAVCEMLEPFEDALDDEKVRSAYIQTLTLIHNAPSIDIVRCKECKHKRQCLKAVQHTTHKTNLCDHSVQTD